MTPVTVVHVVQNLNVGGLERVVVNLVRGFRGSPYRCVVCCLESAGELADEVAAEGCSVFVVGKRAGVDVRAGLELSRIVRREGAGIVHTHNRAAHLYGFCAAKLGGDASLVHTRHGGEVPASQRRKLLNRVLCRGTDALVAVSEDTQRVLLDYDRADPRRVHLILNGVDVASYYNTEDRPAHGPLVGTVARLSPEKDQQTLLAAFRVVIDEFPAARLLIAGTGPCEPELRNRAAALGIAGSVDFLGQVRDVRGVLQSLSVFALSSTTEGLSLTLIEALATGVPVVATDVGGNREVVNPPECGLLVEAAHPVALGQALLTLLREPALRARMGGAGRARAAVRFGSGAMVVAYRRLYDSLMTHKASASGADIPLR